MKRILFYILIILMFSCATALADDGIEVKMNVDDYTISVSGNLGEKAALQDVTLVLLNPGYSLDEINFEEENYQDVFAVWQQQAANSGGEFIFEFGIKNSGEYTIIVSAANDEKIYSVKKYLVQNGHFEDMLESINNSTADEIYNLLENEEQSLSLIDDVSAYYKLKQEDKFKICEYLNSDVQYSDIRMFIADFNKYAITSDILTTDSADSLYKYVMPENKGFSDEVEKIIKEIIDFDTQKEVSAIKTFYAFDEAVQKSILQKVADKNKTDINEFYEILYISVINYELSQVYNWSEVFDIITANQNLITGLDYTSYKNSKNRSSIDKLLMKGNFVNVKELGEFINEKIKSNQDSSTSSSFGGGSGGGSPTVVVPSVSVDTDVNDQIDDNNIVFSDLIGYEWAEKSINELADRGIVTGDETGSFKPGDYVTREAFVKMLVCAMELELDGNCNFVDVAQSDWSYPYIAAAFEAGYVQGISETEFGKGINISREDIAVMVARALGKEINEYKIEFTDADNISDYAVGSIGILCEAGIINGMGDGSFAPKQLCTRAQAAVIIYNMIESILSAE